MIAFYFFLILVRFIVIGIVYPLLRITGESMSWKEYIITCWGGLKGSLSLALALLVAKDEEIDLRARNLVLFLTGSMVFLTLIINGSMTGIIIQWIKLI